MYHNLASTNLIWRLILTDLMTTHNIENKIYEAHNELNINLAVLPNPELVFSAFNYFDLEKLKVVIIGQDPYINCHHHCAIFINVLKIHVDVK